MHGVQKHLSLFTLTEEFDSGANHVLEAVHRVLNEKKQKNGKLPEILFVQVDNCTRENKNRFFMAYFEVLVARGVFLEVQISFLPIGHTHADIDQSFSSIANRLRLVDAITIEDLLQELRRCYISRASAEEMTEVANFSGLCEASHCLECVEGFSQYRYFRFTRKEKSKTNSDEALDFFATTCDVKIQYLDEWAPMDNTSNRKGFLKFAPSFNDTPATDTTPPDNVLEVNRHLRSCEPRIKTIQNLRLLEALRDRVYTRRVEKFHWNLNTCFEMHGDFTGSVPGISITNPGELSEEGEQFCIEQLPYSLNYFLAVRTDDDCADPFWVARTLWVAERDSEGNVSRLKVRWYQAKEGSANAFTATYEMSSYVKNGQRILFDDIVDVRSVLCEFESLTRRGALASQTQKAIRQSLNLD